MRTAVILNSDNQIIEWLYSTDLQNGARVQWSRCRTREGDLVNTKTGKISRAKIHMNNEQAIAYAQEKNMELGFFWKPCP